ncbi:unnamed protein product [Spirodela intermedia]|uniref:Uncharacterized protein n=2 Tax=Spirodela intermedia TaxID=51605 RepID=A0A7I8IKM1_SPIIN|nr:unnamed protein product [Spirodela intermedia]CAA6657547.1 unnamed protein product [Spirodela intermedia]CAA7393625.1 unnamed protein product [Spirodela intermedia]
MEEEVSEYGSGCESGWTMYLGPSHEKAASRLTKGGDSQELDEEEEEGFSMVSDASSGPPQVQEDVYCYYNQHIGEKNGCFMSSSSPSFPTAPLQNECSKRRRVETDGPKQRKGPGRCLDDTASSPFIDFSRNVRGEIPLSWFYTTSTFFLARTLLSSLYQETSLHRVPLIFAARLQHLRR